MRLLLVAALLLGSAVVGVPAEGDDVPMTEWCESAGIPGAVEKLAAEGFNTLAEVLEAELTADDLGELGLDAEEAQKFQAAIAAADGSPPPPAAVPLSSWLAELDLSDSLEKFEAEGFATLGEVVEAELTEDDLKELGLGMKARKLIVLELKKLEEEAAAAEAATETPKVTQMPAIQMDDIIILPNGGQMVGPDAWGTIIQTAIRSPPLTTMSDLDEAVQEHEGFGMMGGPGELTLAAPDGTTIKSMEQAKTTGPPPRVYARHEEDNWVWPGVEVGHREKISLPVSEFYDMDAPATGFAEDMPEEHWAPPPEMTEEDLEAAREEAAKREEADVARRAKAGKSKRARRKAKKEQEKANKAMSDELKAKEGSDLRTAEFVVETLSLQPKVLRVKNFLSATETAAIRQLSAKNEMKEMLKQGPPGCEDLDTGCDVFRNESITWLSPTFGHWTVLPPFAPEPLIAGINRRAAELMRIDKAQMEGMLITQSKRSQHYWAHGDFHTAMHTEDPYDTGFYEDETINKFATLTTFLNDPSTDDGSGFTSGGEMQFPLAGSYAPDAEKGCPPNVGISCGNAYTLETFSQARSSSERAKGWVDCDKGLRIAPEAGTLVIHYNQPAQRHQDGYIDQKAFNAQCAVETTNDDDTGAWRLTMAYTSRMPERPMQQQQGTFLPSKAHPGAGGDAAAIGGGAGGGMKVEIKEEESSGGWF